MKCKACNGTGKIKAIDFTKPDWKDTEKVCPICYGSGVIEQTNEEWFCQLSTEEKAKWLNQQLMYAAAAREQGYFTVDGLIKWLKEKHND